MKNFKFKRTLSLVAVSSLVSLTVAVIPTAARAADPVCQTANFVTTCAGVTSDGAKYLMMVPANYKGTALLYSHGYRYPVDLPAAIPLVGGYKVVDAAEPAPGGNPTIISTLLGQGVGIFGSGFARQGWNADSALKTNVELIGIFKKQFPKTEKIGAWGNSLGGFITQALAEKHPELISAAAPLCMAAGTVEAELTMAGDFLWGLKTYFDPTIKGGNYSAGAAGYGEAMADLGKVFTVMGKLQAAVSTGAWPDTSTVPDAIKAIPSRSALLLIGLMAGVPTQSAHFDSTSGPAGPLATTFPLAVSPALAILENGTTAAVLAVLATYDVELQAGGAIFDNSTTDYASRITDEQVVYNAALSGNGAIAGLLSYLNPLNPAAPRAKAPAASVAKMRALLSHTGKINVPTILFTGTADPITPGGNQQWIIDRYAEQYQDEIAQAKADKRVNGGPYLKPQNKLLSIWSIPKEKYTTFTDAGAPITSTPAASGTIHCNFTVNEYIAVTKLLIHATENGKNLAGGALRTVLRKGGNMAIDRDFRAPLLKFYNEI
jgi:pimeloyl-ACP methyl ester carboxylesterase